MLILYTTVSGSIAGEVISTASYCKHWSYSPGERNAVWFKDLDESGQIIRELIRHFKILNLILTLFMPSSQLYCNYKRNIIWELAKHEITIKNYAG